ncbi:MAG: hybrid sensor histidine kinase/response regulator [Deltaproteobacteria bacterium]|nr:hybrid sensor histidine kinase/response regulator [Deltaproteobacteria bacterium]
MENIIKNLNIVVVDDDPAIRHVCYSILKKNFVNVITFDNGLDALSHIKENYTDIVLVDLKMPKMDGHELIGKITELDKDIVIIVITAYASIENAIEAMQKGVSDFLPKPFTPDELRLAIKKAADKRELIIQKAKALKEKREMEENYLSFVSHQLKSPLFAAQQLLYLLEEGDYNIEADVLSIIKRANKRINEATKLVNEWLLVSRLEKSGFSGNFTETDVIGLINSEIERYNEQIQAKDIKVYKEMPEYFNVETDPSAFSMVISNLISNAIKYNKKGGKIFIRVNEIGEYLKLEIEDTGIGIDKEYIPRLFSKFFRIRNEKTKNIEGTGLGLVIIKKIVDEHNGSIEVESEEDKGTKFTILIPQRHHKSNPNNN